MTVRSGPRPRFSTATGSGSGRRSPAVSTGDVGRILVAILRAAADSHPVAEGQVIDLVHHFELEPARLPGVAVPQSDDSALLLRDEQDQGAVALDADAVADDPVA